MALSSDLMSQLVKATSSNTTKTNSAGSTVYGIIHIVNGETFVAIDGSQILTPVAENHSTVDYLDGARVTVQIKDHTAVITGNLTSPAARVEEVKEIGAKVAEFDTVIADLIQADTIVTENLEAEKAKVDDLYAAIGEIDQLISDKITVTELLGKKATIDQLDAVAAQVDVLDAQYVTVSEELTAANAEINTIKSTYATIEVLDATTANINKTITEELDAVNATIEGLDATYATIDFSNIGEAAIQKIFVDSGIIKDLVMSDGNVTGELVGVTIKGDLIEAGTLKADKLVVKGEDGLYYALNVNADGETVASGTYTAEELQNGLLGSVIIAKSITAEKINVDDLTAFGATIAGFHIEDFEDEEGNVLTSALYSGVKSSVDNTTEGIYMDRDGQFAVGGPNSYIRFAKDENGDFKLVIMLSGGKSVEEAITDGITNLRIGARNLIRNSDNLIFDDYYFANAVSSSVLGVGELGTMTLSVDETEDTGVATVSETETETESEEYTHQGFVDGMTLHDYHLINMENAIIKALAGVATARLTTITLLATNWEGSGTIYSQAVAVEDVSSNSKVDLLPSPEQLNELLLAEISLTAANSDGSITVFALGSAPTTDLEIQAMITEVVIPEVSS